MRAACGILCAVTVASGLWTLLMFLLSPFGAADSLYGSFREGLEAEVGREKANQLIALESVMLYRQVQQIILMVGIPWIITNTAWVIFGIMSTRRDSSTPLSTRRSP